jgi:RimJ/RimL family protein N-acetyltransferase
LVLDQPTMDDADLVTSYCQDPVFERFLTTPWPYKRDDANKFLELYVPGGWRKDDEYTWAIREAGVFVGVIGFRTRNRDVGFWLGAPHRGRGIMPEALDTVLEWVFSWSDGDVYWECNLGNAASAAVARKAGFTYRGRHEGLVVAREGGHPLVETATIAASDDRAPKPGWPDS